TIEAWMADNYDGEFRMTYQQAGSNGFDGLSLSIPAKNADKNFILPFAIDGQNYPLFGEVRSEDDQPLSEILKNPTDIVLSRNVADDLGAEIGDVVRISGTEQEFTVSGIVPTDTEGGLDNILAGILGYYYLDLKAVPFFEGLEPRTATQIYIALDDPDAVDAVDSALQRRYPYLGTTTTTEIRDRNSQISNTVNDLVVIMGLVSMLIGGIGIVNTMLVIVSRRTTEVAVLKTIGLEPEEVTILFMVEAVLMGIVGSLMGILLGWLMAFALQGIAEIFVAQNLTFRFALKPPLNGFIIGVLITTIFGFIPTLAAGQVRPASVLRPTETVIPKAGRLRSFAALMIVLLAISLVAQGLIGSVLDFDATLGSTSDETQSSETAVQGQNNSTTDTQSSEDMPEFLRDLKVFNLLAGATGAIIGLLLGIPIVLGGYLSMRQGRRGRSWVLRILILWPLLLFALPVAGFVFGYSVPTVFVTTITFILIGCLYVLLMLLIWAFGGGALSEFPILGNLPGFLRVLSFIFFPAWTAFLVIMVAVVKLSGLALGLFLGLLFFIHIPAIIVTMVLPAWFIGQLLQRYGFLDLKIALRAMVSTKGRGAATLLALVIGIFALSLITMLVDTIINQFNELLEESTGGNVIVFPAGGEDIIAQVEVVLADHPGVSSFGVSRTFDATFVSLVDVSEEETLDFNDLRARIFANDTDETFEEPQDLVNNLQFSLEGIDARELDSNLPDVKFYEGRQLDPVLDASPDADGYWAIVLPATTASVTADIEVGDLITFSFGEDPEDTQTFRIAGMEDHVGGEVVTFGPPNYTPVAAVGEREPNQVVAIAEVDEEQIADLRHELAQIPGVFVLETRLLNEIITTVINQFTSFPILVAALALFTGGIVIANSVALSTLERRREIGIMKAIGLQRERVLGMLLLENGIMGLVGGLIGVGIGVLILLLILTGISDGELGDAIPIVPALLLMGLCIIIALGAAVVSVWGASGEKPMNVLRYE
ncbi:MAG TPA: FtsX-like permease family protein, partial [Aggregatilineales bacterium]|nr:FtsX-like permease family protein [Aggregatilineales bacterium]